MRGKSYILVVDDEPINVFILSKFLSLEGYEVKTADNGLQALEMLEAEILPDAVILDVMMPQMSGYEVCRRIREKHSLQIMPVMMCSAMTQPEDIALGYKAGASDYLQKPFDRSDLISKINALVPDKT